MRAGKAAWPGERRARQRPCRSRPSLAPRQIQLGLDAVYHDGQGRPAHGEPRRMHCHGSGSDLHV
eukprot:3303100-Alexandrium_andersonii.AAC.1